MNNNILPNIARMWATWCRLFKTFPAASVLKTQIKRSGQNMISCEKYKEIGNLLKLPRQHVCCINIIVLEIRPLCTGNADILNKKKGGKSINNTGFRCCRTTVNAPGLPPRTNPDRGRAGFSSHDVPTFPTILSFRHHGVAMWTDGTNSGGGHREVPSALSIEFWE